jgi:hypothetical protein
MQHGLIGGLSSCCIVVLLVDFLYKKLFAKLSKVVLTHHAVSFLLVPGLAIGHQRCIVN